MTLTLTKTAPTILKLDPKKFGQAIRDYVAARKAKSKANAAADAADKTAKSLQTLLENAMQGHTVAICGSTVLNIKDGNPARATIKLNDGSTVFWDDIAFVTLAGSNLTVDRGQIASIFGGRAGAHTLDVTGE